MEENTTKNAQSFADATSIEYEVCNIQEMASSVLDKITNGELIDWNYWVTRNNMEPMQCAKLYHRIDPIKWPDDYCRGSKLAGDVKEDIDRLCQLIKGYSEKWSLDSFLSFVRNHGEYYQKAPYGMIQVVENKKLAESKHTNLLKEIIDENQNALDVDWIAELWAAIPGESYENKPFWQIRDDYKKQIESAVIDGGLEAVVEIRKPGFDDGFEELTDRNRIRKIKDGWLNGSFVRYTINRDSFRSWLEKSNQWPVIDTCLLRIWFDSEPKAEAPESSCSAKPIESEPKTEEIDTVFREFENLRSNEVSFVVNGSSAKVVIRKRTITVSPQQLGLKVSSQGWKIFEGAAVSSGDLSASLKKLNKTSDLEREKTNIKTAVCRLRTKLKNSMGLIDDPIAYQENSGYKFTFKYMTHALLNGERVTKGADALEYIDGNTQNSGGFWDDDEI
ncbi:hypothetical protein A1507_16905 [Methylomonas koyamae]|uniref:Uncharacterized protein n=1 Tax=Methylomonas koyamae TaxID=702114 RepID=A0A177N985_9GAMM|nr:hypothetical protein [Methylomonas koyamae]OAI13759.1 hypothetical protein A1507_16905 [Methylomonas koyamae]